MYKDSQNFLIKTDKITFSVLYYRNNFCLKNNLVAFRGVKPLSLESKSNVIIAIQKGNIAGTEGIEPSPID